MKIKSVKANLQIRKLRGKNEDQMTKFGKISKLGYMEIFMKV